MNSMVVEAWKWLSALDMHVLNAMPGLQPESILVGVDANQGQSVSVRTRSLFHQYACTMSIRVLKDILNRLLSRGYPTTHTEINLYINLYKSLYMSLTGCYHV